MRDLHEVLTGSLAARERAIAGQVSSDEVLAGTVSRVRRRRRVRAAARGGAVLGVGALVAAAGWGVWGTRAVAPAGPPTVSVTPTPSRTPTTTPTPSPTASTTQEPSAATVSVLGLGDLPQATEATLAKATTGWALVAYSRQGETAGSDLVNALLLADPNGGLYHLSDLPNSFDVPLELTGHWTAGSRTATVAVGSGIGDQKSFQAASLDVLTGVVTTGPVQQGFPAALLSDGRWLTSTTSADGSGMSFGRATSDGAATPLAIVTDIVGAPMVSPNGSQVLVANATRYAVVDTGSGAVVEHDMAQAGRTCTVVGWLDDQRLATVCGVTAGSFSSGSYTSSVTEPTREVVRVADGTVLSSTPLSAGQVWPTSGVPTPSGFVSAGALLATGAGSSGALSVPSCSTAALRWMPDGGSSDIAVPTWDGATVSTLGSGGRYVYLSELGCGSAGPNRVSVLAVDAQSGAVTQLLDAVDVGTTGGLGVLAAQ